MAQSYIYLLPILVFLWFPLSIIISFLIAVILGHVKPLFPYISDTGTYSPESCVFGQLLNIGSILIAIVMYIRYRHCRELYVNHNLSYTIQKLNFVSMFMGLFSALGVSIVGNFQETNVFSIHLIGAIAGFACGAVYLILQTVISFKLFPMTGKQWILYARVAITSLCVLAFLLSFLFAVLSFHYFKGKDIDDIMHWSEKDGGWEFHIVSTISEWLTAILPVTYLLTYTPEFRNITILEPVLHIDDNLIVNQHEPIRQPESQSA